jgi:hypothetical protein
MLSTYAAIQRALGLLPLQNRLGALRREADNLSLQSPSGRQLHVLQYRLLLRTSWPCSSKGSAGSLVTSSDDLNGYILCTARL